MKRSTQQLAVCLAASSITEHALVDAMHDLTHGGVTDFVDQVMRLRHMFRSDEFLSQLELNLNYSPYSGIADEISRLLRVEARLSASDAARCLQQGIREISSEKLPPFKPRTGFRQWVERILDQVPPSELLHVATRIRNERVHQPTHWPLRDR